MIGKYWNRIATFLIVSMALEIFVFNSRAIFSMRATEQPLEYHREENTVIAGGMLGKPHYVYIGLEGDLAVTFTLMLRDEGNAEFYEVGQVSLYPKVEKSKYLSVHSYGAVQEMKLVLESGVEAQVTGITYDARVPWFISLFRIIAVFLGLCVVWGLRPGSAVYGWRGSKRQECAAAGILILANCGVFLFLVRSNPAFLAPVWPYHWQYHQLAVSLSQGRLDIDVGDAAVREGLAALDNPYDSKVRMETVPGVDAVWDICYFQGRFYVYFGVVPVLVFYLPFYLLFHAPFPTWGGVFLCGCGILAGMYYLVWQIRRRYFPQASFPCYLLLSLIGGNSLYVSCAMLHADFYYLPIMMALFLSLWGLGFVLSALDGWESGQAVGGRLVAGGICLALVAGCRPQFLVGSFLLLPLLGPLLWRERREKATWKRVLLLALPYVTVAAGLMLYNRARFGSVFDFGANYNLTTNDMTRRGMSLGRLPDGFFMYLFQPVSLRLSFPFAEVTALYSDYLGGTIRDWTYGGAFWIKPLLLVLFGFGVVREKLREKELFGPVALSIGMALLVIFADTQMAGILNRYYMDFLWLLIVPAIILLFQMLENYQGTRYYRWVLCFILVAGAAGIFYELGISIRGSGLINDNVHRYYMMKAFFQ